MADMIRKDVMIEGAARAHDEAFPVPDKRLAIQTKPSRRSWNRYRHEGHPVALRWFDLCALAPNKERLIAQSFVPMHDEFMRMTREDLIASYREVRLKEPMVEANDRRDDVDPKCGWSARSASSVRDGAWELRKGAIEAELEIRCRTNPREYSVEVIMAEMNHA